MESERDEGAGTPAQTVDGDGAGRPADAGVLGVGVIPGDEPAPRAPAVSHDIEAEGSDVLPLAGDSEMARRFREHNWAATPLGPVEAWPPSLRTAAALVLGSGFPSILVWGPELVQVYNDAYVGLIGSKHPAAFGAPTHFTWPEIRYIQEPIFARVFAGETVNI